MKRLRVRRIIFWSLIFFLVLGVIMAVLFPAGSDPFSAHSGSLAAKGRTIYELMKTNEWRRKTEGVWCDPKTYDNSVAFITVLCEKVQSSSV